MKRTLIEVPTMCRFSGIGLIRGRISDQTTMLRFRHLIEKHELGDR